MKKVIFFLSDDQIVEQADEAAQTLEKEGGPAAIAVSAERNFVPPLGSTAVTVRLSSSNVNETMQCLYRVKCSIGSTPTLLVRGKVEALDISFKTSFVAFGDMKKGAKVRLVPNVSPTTVCIHWWHEAEYVDWGIDEAFAMLCLFGPDCLLRASWLKVTKAVELTNASSCPTSFSFPQSFPESILQLSPISGLLPAKRSVRISLSLAFDTPCSFYQRLFCLVKGASYPLPLDVAATCTSDTEYPARITQGHIHLEQWRLFTEEPLHPRAYEMDALGSPVGVPLPKIFPPTYFLAAVDDFPVHKKQVTVSWRGREDGGMSKEALEVVAYPSVQRNHQATTSESIVVPQLLQLRVSGVFASSTPPPPPPLREALAAAVVLPESNIRMPPCAVGQIVWRVLEILNRGDETLDFQILPTQEVEKALATGRPTDDLRQAHGLLLLLLLKLAFFILLIAITEPPGFQLWVLICADRQRGEEEAEFELDGHEVKTLRLCFSPRSAETFEGELLLKAQIQPNPMLVTANIPTAALANGGDFPHANAAAFVVVVAASAAADSAFNQPMLKFLMRFLLLLLSLLPWCCFQSCCCCSLSAAVLAATRSRGYQQQQQRDLPLTEAAAKAAREAGLHREAAAAGKGLRRLNSSSSSSSSSRRVLLPDVLHSRCSSTLKLALTPLRSKPFRFRVSLLPAEETPQAEPQSLGSQPKRQAEDLRPLCCFFVEGEGSVPSVHLADIRYLSPSRDSPFSLYFSAPPSAADAAFAAAEGLEARKAAVESLSRISCFCGFYLENSAEPQTTILLTFFNPGSTRADEKEEKPAVLRPESFSVPSREYRQVVLQLQHQKARDDKERKKEEEEEKNENTQRARLEETEIILHVKLGRTLRLLFISEPVSATSPFLFCPPLVERFALQLDPVPIGRPEGCWRSFVLHNMSAVPAFWQLAASLTKEARLIGNELLALAPNGGVLAARSAVYVHVCLSLAQQGNHVFPLVVKYRKSALEGSADTADTHGKTEQTLSFSLATTGCTDTSEAFSEKTEEEGAAATLPLSSLPHAAVSLPLNAKLTLERLVFEPRPFSSGGSDVGDPSKPCDFESSWR
ncbi:hypothetical protein Emag_007720 [Eimeria magna]